MNTVPNGIPAVELVGAQWQKSMRSQVNGDCVELARLADGSIAMRNSRHPAGPALIYTQDEVTAMILGAKDGDFDNFLA